MKNTDIKTIVKEKYGRIALQSDKCSGRLLWQRPLIRWLRYARHSCQSITLVNS
jgi:hypothetical protein